jgi:hypothetical protein
MLKTAGETMGYWTDLSIEFANQRNYLDELYKIYPTIPDGIRSIDEDKWNHIEDSFNARDNISLIMHLLHLDLFPIKDSYAIVRLAVLKAVLIKAKLTTD